MPDARWKLITEALLALRGGHGHCADPFAAHGVAHS